MRLIIVLVAVVAIGTMVLLGQAIVHLFLVPVFRGL